MMMPGREYQAQPSRFGFNGKENDNEVKGFGNQQDYGMRIYDTRIGKFLSVDPISQNYPYLTPYQFASNTPVSSIDNDGLEGKKYNLIEWLVDFGIGLIEGGTGSNLKEPFTNSTPRPSILGFQPTKGPGIEETLRSFVKEPIRTSKDIGAKVIHKSKTDGIQILNHLGNQLEEINNGNPRAIGNLGGVILVTVYSGGAGGASASSRVATLETRLVEGSESFSSLLMKGDEILSASSRTERTILYHYTNLEGQQGILSSKTLNPSLKAVNPNDVRYGDGQYLSDIAPGTKTPSQLSREFLNLPFRGDKYTHYVAIDVTGLNITKGRQGVFVIPNSRPLDLTNRIVGSGQLQSAPIKIKNP